MQREDVRGKCGGEHGRPVRSEHIRKPARLTTTTCLPNILSPTIMTDPNLPLDHQHIDDEPEDIELDCNNEPIIPDEPDFTGASDELGYAPDR